MALKWVVLFILLSIFSLAIEAVERYPFPSKQQQQQFQRLTGALRCLVCQNESLNDSAAPLAEDLRREVYQRVLKHQEDEEIKQFLVQRYGDFVLLQPPLTERTLFLWFAPFILLGLGFVLLAMRIRYART